MSIMGCYRNVCVAHGLKPDTYIPSVEILEMAEAANSAILGHFYTREPGFNLDYFRTALKLANREIKLGHRLTRAKEAELMYGVANGVM